MATARAGRPGTPPSGSATRTAPGASPSTSTPLPPPLPS